MSFELARSYLARARRSLERGDYELAVRYARAAAETAIHAAYRALGRRPQGHTVAELLEDLGAPPDLRVDAAILEPDHLDFCDCGSIYAYDEPYTRHDAEEAVRVAERVLRYCEAVAAKTGQTLESAAAGSTG